MKRGAKVFRNLASTGDTDIVLEKDGNLLRVDVKHMKYDPRSDNYTGNNHHAPPPNTVYAFVHPITWDVRWRNNKNRKPDVPEFWEDFWD